MCTSNVEKQDPKSFTSYSQEERQELLSMARGLRRMKRQMLLKQVEKPQSPVDSFRSLLARAVANDYDETGSVSSASYDRKSDFRNSPPASPRKRSGSLNGKPDYPIYSDA